MLEMSEFAFSHLTVSIIHKNTIKCFKYVNITTQGLLDIITIGTYCTIYVWIQLANTHTQNISQHRTTLHLTIHLQ